MITWLDFSTIPQRYAKINLIKTAAASGTVLVCMDVSLQSAVLMYCTSMETVTSLHNTYYTLFIHLRYIEIHMKGFQKARTSIARTRKFADFFRGH